MITSIRQKLTILGNRAPFSQAIREYIDYLEKVDWIVMNLNLDGRGLKREQVEAVLNGEVILNGRVQEHLIVTKLENLREEIYGNKEKSFLNKMFRRTNPPIIEYDYQPPMFNQVEEMYDELMDFVRKENNLEDEFMKAAIIHNRFIEIFPFNEDNQLIARAFMEYYLVSLGLPMVYLDITEEKYNRWIINYLKTKSSKELRDYLESETLKRLELFMELTRQT